MEKLITVTITDAGGKSFSRDWKQEANRLDVLRWMAENPDVPHYLDVTNIVSVSITETEK